MMLLWSRLRLRRRSGWLLLVIGTLLLATIASEETSHRLWPLPLTKVSQLPRSTRIVDRQGRLLRVTVDDQHRRCLPLSLSDMGPYLPMVVVAAEDKRFAQHDGIDEWALLRATMTRPFYGSAAGGASTLTMQWTRIVEPAPRTVPSKLRELWRARQWETHWRKEDILAAYLNHAPFGRLSRGVEAASWAYFGCRAADLSLAESAALIALLPAPSRLGQPDHRTEWRQRRDRILDALHRNNKIDKRDWHRARNSSIETTSHTWPWYAVHACQRALANQDDTALVAERRPGLLRLHLDLELQQQALKHVGHLPHELDGNVVIVVENGCIRVLIGDADDRFPGYDASTGHRIAGSTLKPLLFATAMEHGLLHRGSVLNDDVGDFAGYRPTNADRRHFGAMRADTALSYSRNLPAIRVLARLGLPAFRDAMAAYGITVDEHAGLDAALGTSGVSPYRLALAYDALFHHENPAIRRQILAALTLRQPHRRIGLDAWAWKTGTSQGRRDAWCIGHRDGYTVLVWLGRRDGGADARLVGSGLASDLAASIARMLADQTDRRAIIGS